MQWFASTKGGVGRVFVGLMLGLGGWAVLTKFTGVFALMSGTSEPRPELGTTYHVYVSRRGGGSWIYVKPWLGYFYDFEDKILLILFGALVLFALLVFIARKSAALRRRMGRI